jgi:hypothetical protein
MRGGKNMSTRIRPNKTMIIVSVMSVLGAIGLHRAFSGQLDPPAAPAPTMYTLEEIYNLVNSPSSVWRMTGKTFTTHAPNPRFAVHDAGDLGDPEDDLVLDKETGLIWARAPLGWLDNIWDAAWECRDLDLGHRKGWRLPTVEELSSLLDMDEDSPALPNGHPFLYVENDWYWTDPTTAASYVYAEYFEQDLIYVVNMGNGDVSYYSDAGSPEETYVWPVWGGKSSGF